MSDKKDIEFIKSLFEKKFKGILLKKIPESKKETEKTADFEVIFNNEIIAIAELKKLVDVEPCEDNGYKKGKVIGEWWRNGNLDPRKIARKIKESIKQLSSYNHPKIIILLNESFIIDESDYLQTKNIKDKNKKSKIDLYIWVNKTKNNIILFDIGTETGKTLHQKFLSKDS